MKQYTVKMEDSLNRGRRNPQNGGKGGGGRFPVRHIGNLKKKNGLRIGIAFLLFYLIYLASSVLKLQKL